MALQQTHICAFLTQKGGAGKSVLTNMISNEIILWHLLTTGEKVNVLVVDIDPQQTNTAKRKQDIAMLQYREEMQSFQELPIEVKSEIGRLQRRYALIMDSGFSPYKLKAVDTDNDRQIDSAIDQIQSGQYDYVFIDFPATLTQRGTGEFLKLVNHVFVPTSINPSDMLGTECFLDTMQTLNLKFKSTHIIWNKFEVSRTRKTNALTAQLGKKYNVSFLTSRVPYSPLNDNNTLIPSSLNVNLNSNSFSVAKPYLQTLAEEFISLLNNE